MAVDAHGSSLAQRSAMAKPPKKVSEPPPRRNGVRDVGSLLPDVGAVAFRRFGFVQSTLLGRWREVVGPVYARWSVPESLKFPRGEKTGGTLTIRVEGPFSLQLQHVAPQILDRVNRILGHNAVARLKLVQGEVPKQVARDAPPPQAKPVETGNLAGVKDDGLRAALEELAAQVAVAKGPPRIN
jgi:hypothetical protein